MNLNLKKNQKYDNTKNSKNKRENKIAYKICTALRNWQRLNFVNNYNAFKTEFLTKEYTLNEVT